MQYSTVFASALLVGSAVAGYTNGTTVTTDVTVTDYTTYCPYSTVVTVTKCEQDKCHPTEITVTEATTLTVTGECVVPTTYTTEVQTKTETVCDTCEHPTTAAPTSAAPTSAAPTSATPLLVNLLPLLLLLLVSPLSKVLLLETLLVPSLVSLPLLLLYYKFDRPYCLLISFTKVLF